MDNISIHAPARGATDKMSADIEFDDISIHAPARGATLEELEIPAGETISIHAPARGATGNYTRQYIQQLRFQSTHPRGVRLALNQLD